MKLIPLIICIVLGVLIGVGLYAWFADYAVQMTIIGLLASTFIVGAFVVHLVKKRGLGL